MPSGDAAIRVPVVTSEWNQALPPDPLRRCARGSGASGRHRHPADLESGCRCPADAARRRPALRRLDRDAPSAGETSAIRGR